MNFTAISYAQGEDYQRKQQRLNECFRRQGFDDIRSYGPADLDPQFLEEFRDTLACKTQHVRDGKLMEFDTGCCIWKPYLILKTLESANDGDIMLYMDVEDTIDGPLVLKKYLHDVCLRNSGFVGMALHHRNDHWTRRDAFHLMGCDTLEYRIAPQIEAGFIGFQKSARAIAFLKSWLSYGSNPHIIANLPNIHGENYPGFVEHRYDQSIYSILIKMYGFQTEPHIIGPSLYGLIHRCNVP